MQTLDIKEYDLDYIMENYFNTDKEVMFLCDYKTAWEILKYSEYEDGDFESYFSVDINCEYPYYSVYKDANEVFIIELLTTIDNKLYPEYTADNILIQDRVKEEHKDIIDRCNVNQNLIMIKDFIYNNESLTTLLNVLGITFVDNQGHFESSKYILDELSTKWNEFYDKDTYQQGVKDTLKAIGELFNIEIDIK